MLFTLGISENSMNRMKDVFWPEKMKIYFEQAMRLAPVQMRTFASGRVLKAIEDNAHERGALEVAETDMVKAFLENTPVFFRDEMVKMLKELGINAKEMMPNERKNDTSKIEEDIKKAAEIAGVTYNDSICKKILSVYAKCFSNVQSSITLATTTKKIERRGLHVKYLDLFNLHNPYKMAIENNLIVKSNHPIDGMFDEICDRCPVMGYGMEFGVSTGIEIVWIFFASHLPQPIQKLLTLPSMPVGFSNSIPFLEKYCLNLVSIVGIEYQTKSVTLHYRTAQMKPLTVELISEMLEDLEFVLPKKELIELCIGASTLFCTYNWEMNRIQKISFGVCASTKDEVPRNLNLSIERFINQVPFAAPTKKYIYSITFSKRGQYLKIESDYSGTMVDAIKGSGAPKN